MWTLMVPREPREVIQLYAVPIKKQANKELASLPGCLYCSHWGPEATTSILQSEKERTPWGNRVSGQNKGTLGLV